MKQIAKLGMCVVIIVVLSGCWNIKTNTKAPILREDAVGKLNVKQPVSVKNFSTKSGDIVIGKSTGVKVHGDLYNFTESAIGAAKNVLERQGIEVNNTASKTLELSVYDAKFKEGKGIFITTTALRVRTGDGLEKEYAGMEKHRAYFSTSAAVERTIAQCVRQMLNDREIISYLEN